MESKEVRFPMDTPLVLKNILYNNNREFRYYTISEISPSKFNKTYKVFQTSLRIILLPNHATIEGVHISELFKESNEVSLGETGALKSNEVSLGETGALKSKYDMVKYLDEKFDTPDGYLFGISILITNPDKIEEIDPEIAHILYLRKQKEHEKEKRLRQEKDMQCN